MKRLEKDLIKWLREMIKNVESGRILVRGVQLISEAQPLTLVNHKLAKRKRPDGSSSTEHTLTLSYIDTYRIKKQRS